RGCPGHVPVGGVRAGALARRRRGARRRAGRDRPVRRHPGRGGNPPLAGRHDESARQVRSAPRILFAALYLRPADLNVWESLVPPCVIALPMREVSARNCVRSVVSRPAASCCPVAKMSRTSVMPFWNSPATLLPSLKFGVP